MLMVPTPATPPFLSQPVSMASRGVPYIQLIEEENPDLQMALHNMQGPPRSGRYRNTVPRWDIPEGQW